MYLTISRITKLVGKLVERLAGFADLAGRLFVGMGVKIARGHRQRSVAQVGDLFYIFENQLLASELTSIPAMTFLASEMSFAAMSRLT